MSLTLSEFLVKIETHYKSKTLQDDCLPRVRAYIISKSEQRWDNAIDPMGVKWPALSPKTIAYKVANGYSREILVRTGAARARGFVTSIRNNILTVRFPSESRYMERHHWGSDRLPRRRILGLSPDDKKAIRAIVRDSFRFS